MLPPWMTKHYVVFIYDAFGFEEEFKKLGYKVTVVQEGEDTVDFDEL